MLILSLLLLVVVNGHVLRAIVCEGLIDMLAMLLLLVCVCAHACVNVC